MGADYIVEDIPADMQADAKVYREKLIEKVSEVDDQILEKYLGGEEISEESRSRRRCASASSTRCATRRRRSSSSSAARPSRTRACSRCSTRSSTTCRRRSTSRPSKGSTSARPSRPRSTRPADDNAPFAALAFKIMTDPFVGQLTFLRVYSGVLTAGSSAFNATKGKTERIGRLLKMHANKREEIKEVYAGDIAAAVGLKSVTTGDTICDEKKPGPARGDGLPGAGHLAGHRAEDQGRPGKARPGPRQADGRGSDLPRQVRPRDRPDGHLGHGRAAPRDHRRPPEARVQRRGQRRQAAGRLQGNADARRRGRRPLHQADRRPRPVRPRQDPADAARGRARASSSSTASSAAPFRASSSSRSRKASRKP